MPLRMWITDGSVPVFSDTIRLDAKHPALFGRAVNPVFDEVPARIDNAPMLDDAERQSIREWFRGLVRARSAREGPDPAGGDEEPRLTRDLRVPRDLASGVKGGSAPVPSDDPDE